MTRVIRFYKWRLCGGLVASLLMLSATLNAAKSQQPNDKLLTGQPIAREMRGGEEHTYEFTLNADQYVRVVLDQKGIDVVLALSGADGKQLLEVDNNLSGTRGMEVVSLVAEVTGDYFLKVRSLEKGAAPGRYELRLDELKTATDADRTRVAAERAYVAGAQVQAERTRDSRRKAIERY